MEKTYAHALWQLVVNGMNPKDAVHAIHARLEKEGRASLMPRVASAFSRIAERESRKTDYTLTVAREEDLAHAKKEMKALTGDLGIDVDNLKTQVDDTLIGGWRLEGNERLVDASYKRELLDLYNSVTRV
jgi:F-type H+-transporting ATPase subunit delta